MEKNTDMQLTLAGTVISMFAWNLPSLIVGRFMVGISSSLITISATAGLAALAASGSAGVPVNRVAMLASSLNVLGFGLGPLIGGVAGQWLPQPLTTAYLVPLAILEVYLLAQQSASAPAKYRAGALLFLAASLTLVGTVGAIAFMWGPYML